MYCTHLERLQAMILRHGRPRVPHLDEAVARTADDIAVCVDMFFLKKWGLIFFVGFRVLVVASAFRRSHPPSPIKPQTKSIQYDTHASKIVRAV